MASINDAAKQQVLQHMNANHRLDLGLYLRHVNGLSTAQLAAEGEPEMLDINLQSIVVRTATSGHVHTVRLTPPMASFYECRARLVTLSLGARTALNTSVAFRPPVGFDIAIFVTVGCYFVVAALVFSGYDTIPAYTWSLVFAAFGVPPPPAPATASRIVASLSNTIGGPDGFRWCIRATAMPVLAIHSAEVWWFDHSRLAPCGMLRGSRDWCLWMGSAFLEGMLAIWRFDRTVKADKARAAQEANQEKH